VKLVGYDGEIGSECGIDCIALESLRSSLLSNLLSPGVDGAV